MYRFLLDIFNWLLLLSLLLALADKLPINKLFNSIPICCLLASDSDSESNELKMYIRGGQCIASEERTMQDRQCRTLQSNIQNYTKLQ